MNYLARVVVPIHKIDLTNGEKVSLLQCGKVLHEHPITVVAPEGLDVGHALSLLTNGGASVNVRRFSEEAFASLEGYNQLMLSREFYQTFEDAEYILIYQPDAFVFSDQLAEFCGMGYDYIGAPWFASFFGVSVSKRMVGAGNGGFSLRRVKACLDVLDYEGTFRPTDQLVSSNNSPVVKWKKLSSERRQSTVFAWSVKYFTAINSTTEDYFWAKDVPSTGIDFKVAPPEVAMAFSFEKHPSYLYQKMDGRLPFGCHAWEKYEYELFWRQMIAKYGYKL